MHKNLKFVVYLQSYECLMPMFLTTDLSWERMFTQEAMVHFSAQADTAAAATKLLTGTSSWLVWWWAWGRWAAWPGSGERRRTWIRQAGGSGGRQPSQRASSSACAPACLSPSCCWPGLQPCPPPNCGEWWGAGSPGPSTGGHCLWSCDTSPVTTKII